MTQPVDVLAIAAHPDDAEVGCGGALLLAGAGDARTGVIDITDGEASTRGTPESRARERDRASDLLGLAVRERLGVPDGTVGTVADHRLALVRALRDLRPRVVLAPFPEDRHPDHAAAGRLTREACFLAGVRKFGGDDPHRPSRLYHYMVHHLFTPSFVLDVSSVWDRKMAAVRAYQSQFAGGPGPATEIAGPRFLELLEARASVHGAMVGAEWGEPFHQSGPVAVTALPGLDSAGSPPPYGMYH
jgi:bacillithiol biosynthesis deacetylase BshB1